MGYIASDNIHAYPVASRGGDYPFSRISSEYNTTQMTRNISDKSGFVLTDIFSTTPTASTENVEIKFVLNGYFFRTYSNYICNAAGDLSSIKGKTIYACIKVTATSATYQQELDNLSATNPSTSTPTSVDINQSGTTNFCAITVIATNDATTDLAQYSYYTPIFDVADDTNGTLTIKEEYRYKINRESIDMKWIPL